MISVSSLSTHNWLTTHALFTAQEEASKNANLQKKLNGDKLYEEGILFTQH